MAKPNIDSITWLPYNRSPTDTLTSCAAIAVNNSEPQNLSSNRIIPMYDSSMEGHPYFLFGTRYCPTMMLFVFSMNLKPKANPRPALVSESHVVLHSSDHCVLSSTISLRIGYEIIQNNSYNKIIQSLF